MREVTAIAERYKELGFRVIEGGKSNKLVVIDSRGLGTTFGREHDDVLRSIDNHRAKLESGAADLRSEIATDFRLDGYIDDRGKRQRCYLLTENGFHSVAARWDAVLCYRTVRAFHELQEAVGLSGRWIGRPVVDRLQELRGDWTQGELFPAPTSVPKVRPRFVGPRLIDNPNDPSDAPIFGDDSDQNLMGQYRRRESWHEHQNGVDYVVTCRYREDRPWYIRIMLADMSVLHDRKCWFVPSDPQSMLTWEDGKTPKEVFQSVLNRLGFNSELIRATLDYIFR